ncbi:MAG TPA: orotidine 5'-phosphate decarboxylase [bacterium]|jgi:3-keto-L-gulonate-6-phosphate decarboxylase|nr:orotidine 5'-phosphate decarboxylase [bacterium]HOG38769.1 orotidine 5'-phosphate decarboxylase [bacterium]HQI03463.1 orotidine 5'-phosphate decarboxylase [bacterium]
MEQNNPKRNSLLIQIILGIVLFAINPALGIIYIIFNLATNKKSFSDKSPNSVFSNFLQKINQLQNTSLTKNSFSQNTQEVSKKSTPSMALNLFNSSDQKIRLQKRKKYLHIALNNTLEEASKILYQLPFSEKFLIEVGTPLIKTYGTGAISQIKSMVPTGTYIVADNKCADLANREVEIMANAGANAATCLGVAPIETINSFIEECEKHDIDSIIDMMNVESSIEVLKKLKKLPNVVMLHRGVDESEFSKEKQIPYHQIKQIKGAYNILVAVAGGDTIKEVQRAVFNDADIVVVWKNFYSSSSDTANLAEMFLKKIQ